MEGWTVYLWTARLCGPSVRLLFCVPVAIPVVTQRTAPSRRLASLQVRVHSTDSNYTGHVGICSGFSKTSDVASLQAHDPKRKIRKAKKVLRKKTSDLCSVDRSKPWCIGECASHTIVDGSLRRRSPRTSTTTGSLGKSVDIVDCSHFAIMIVALFALTFSIAQVVISKAVISENKRFAVALTFALLSAIPVLVQFVTLVEELWRAGRYCIKLLVQRLILTCLGDYGQGLPLMLMHRGNLNSAMTSLGERVKDHMDSFYGESLITRALMHLFSPGWLTFRDAFSGKYQLKNLSVALWMANEAEPSETWFEAIEPPDEDVWKGTKEIRDAELFWRFGHVSDPSEDVPPEGSASANHGGGDIEKSAGGRFVRVPDWRHEFGAGPDIARAIRETTNADLNGVVGVRPKDGSGFLSKFDPHRTAGLYATSQENYVTFCNLMKVFTNDMFF